MKVAVMSVVPTLGKTTIIQMLGSVYSRSQGKDVFVLSTGDAMDNTSIVTNYVRSSKITNPHVFKAMVENVGDDPKELLNYAAQSGDERLFIADIFNGSMSREDKEECFMLSLKSVPASLTLIEICGDVDSEFNSEVLKECDCAFLMIDTSEKCLRLLPEFIHKLPKCNARDNLTIVVSKYDPVVTSEKKLSELTKIPVQNIHRFPYSPIIGKMSLMGELDKITYNIVRGEYTVLQFRQPLQELMEFIYDTPTRKVVRSIDRWYK